MEGTTMDLCWQVFVMSFAAVSNNINRLSFGSGTKLVIEADLPESEPSVYELEPHDKSTSLSACLFADYSPGKIEVSVDDGEPENTNSSVVVVDGEASYGEVRWTKNTKNLKCTATYGGRTFSANNNATADVCSGTPMSFQTDERLNLLSLTVLGLRFIFLKSVAVNLVLTFRLWYIKN